MSAIVMLQFIYLKLGKKGPYTLKVISAPTTNTETYLAHLEVLLTQYVYLQWDQTQTTTTVLQSLILDQDC